MSWVYSCFFCVFCFCFLALWSSYFRSRLQPQSPQGTSIIKYSELRSDSILTLSTKNCLDPEEDLLVSSSEVTSVMDISFKQQSHGNATRQHSNTHIYFLSGWFPFQRPPLHNWTIGGKVHTIKSNCIIESVAFHSDKREVRHTQRDQAKIREEVLIKGMVRNTI